jgi:hypothetical protein
MGVRDTLEWVRVFNRLWCGCEDRMRWHGVETTRRLDVGWPDCLVMRTEIESSAAHVARPADHMQTFATGPPTKTIVTAWFLDTIAAGRRFAACTIGEGFTA